MFFGQYEQDNDLKNGPEPIEWRVLEVKGDKMFLLSEYILDAKPFNEFTAGSIWGTSSLRDWLNNDFMQSSFQEDEISAICMTEVDNSASQTNYMAQGSANTEDYIYLLSDSELKNYFESPEKAVCIATDYAKPNVFIIRATTSYDSGGSIPTGTSFGKRTYENEAYAPWWLRTHGLAWDRAGAMHFSTRTDWFKNALAGAANYGSYCGVRPAMWVDIGRFLELLPEPEPEITLTELEAITFDESVTADTVLGETTWKMWLPEGFKADELTEADIADHYIAYYLRDDDIIAVQYSDNANTLAEWQKELTDRGFTIDGLYNLNGSEAVLYRDEEEDTATVSVFDGRGKLLEVTFYPYSTLSDEADTVIASIQQEAGKKRLSGASGNSNTSSFSGETSEELAAAPEEAYSAMVAAYKEKRYSDSYGYYEQAKGYQDADKYGNLLKARLCYDLNLKDEEIDALEKAIVNDISFADSADVLVCNSAIAYYYLLGFWKTSNGMHSYEVKENGRTTTTVPVVPRTGDSYSIINGTYWRYFNGKWDERTAQYDFKPISKSKMEIYSYQVNQSYTFNKIR